MTFFKQAWLLTVKNLRILWVRKGFSTIFSAFIVPVIYTIFIAYARFLFTPLSQYGISQVSPLPSLGDAMTAATGGRNTVVFVNNRLSGGAIDRVIDAAASSARSAGKSVEILADESELSTVCRSSLRGTTSCYAAAVFYSSPDEGPSQSWNYTIRGDAAIDSQIDAKQESNDAQIYLLPLQHQINAAISFVSQNGTQNALDRTVDTYLYTSLTQEQNKDRIRINYANSVINVLAVAFLEALAAVTYHLPGFMASERETGMLQLIEGMFPGSKPWKARTANIVAYYWAFTITYFPGWLLASVILGLGVFPKTNMGIVIINNLLTGFALVSFSILGASFFRRAQMSGIVVTISLLVLGIIAQVVKNADTATVAILSLLFTPMTYVNFGVMMARYEKKNVGTNLLHPTDDSPSRLPGIALWVFLIIQIFVYPMLGALVQRSLCGTHSQGRSVITNDGTESGTVALHDFSKSYVPNWFKRYLGPLVGQHYSSVVAVSNLTLSALKGQVFVLLGPNGSGKSTTLDAIAGMNKITSGTIQVHTGSGALGICPQRNVLWDDLTVKEHIAFFCRLKNPSVPVNEATIEILIKSVDLKAKTNTFAKHLSGGQKRKLQLGMMLSGGSQVCCVDEVSSGLDPLSRRKIWDILLAERGSRTIILTTHFLDEADVLADHIAIMSRGTLRVAGSSVELKSSLGRGYCVRLRTQDMEGSPPEFSGVRHSVEQSEVIYTTVNQAEVAIVLNGLHERGLTEYQVSGPTIEDVFLKVVDEAAEAKSALAIRHSDGASSPSDKETSHHKSELQVTSSTYQPVSLLSGSRPGILKQASILLGKRWTILGRNWLPYIIAFAVPVLVAGVSTLFLKGFELPKCPRTDAPQASQVKFFSGQEDFSMVVGPADHFGDADLARFSSLLAGGSSSNSLDIDNSRRNIHVVDTLGDFNRYIEENRAILTPGGVFLGDTPTFAFLGEKGPQNSIFVQSVMDTFLQNATLHTQYASFDRPWLPSTGNSLELLIVFGIALAVYPGLFALYPTFERKHQIRALHYSNGVRPLPLWLAYLVFDGAIVLVASALVVVIFATYTDQWYHIAYLFPVFMLSGWASVAMAYMVSLIATSQLAAFAGAAFGQVFYFLIYIIAYIVVLLYSPPDKADSSLLIVNYVLCIISPACNIIRALIVSMNVFSVCCTKDGIFKSNPAGLDLYGGPILFSCIQIVLFVGLIVWHEVGSSWLSLGRKTRKVDMTGDVAVPGNSDSALQVVDISKSFKKTTALDHVSFRVEKSEIFALLGPNGAGKSTIISLIRGDQRPSGREGDIFVGGISVTGDMAGARHNLGVCPQIDAIDRMTVLEHLRFYGKVRGIANVDHNMFEIMRAVGIEQYSNRMAKNLSGGSKRKLSLAIALMGNPSTLLLDEPGTGLDAASKRLMWRALASVSPGRSVLLTTHDMEEADALALRVGILAKRMLASGTSSSLRAQNGDVYQIHLILASAPHSDAQEMTALQDWITSHLQGAGVDGPALHGQLRIKIARDAAHSHGTGTSIKDIFVLLEENKQSLGLRSYSVGEATLGQVFLRIVGEHNVGEEEVEAPSKPFFRWTW